MHKQWVLRRHECSAVFVRGQSLSLDETTSAIRQRAASLSRKVVIGIITCRRPLSLSRLLDTLQQLRIDPSLMPQICVVVVDNDASGSSRSIVDALSTRSRWPMRWFHEPRQGIPFARNEVVRHASHADFVAFIDDDEEPSPTWLHALLQVQQLHAADVVLGPVLPRFETAPPAWIVRGRFFDRQRRATGAAMLTGGTGNILLRRSILPEPAFRWELATTGGSDAYLLQQLRLAGARMVWADEAVVYEWVPPSRVNARWLLMRAWRAGLMRGYTHRHLPSYPLEGIVMAVRGLVSVCVGGAKALLFGLAGKHRLARALRQVCYGAGLFAGVFGVQHEEYRIIHGR